VSTYNRENDRRSGAAEEVRRAFAALPFDQQVSTLIRVELDMVGDAVETVVSAVSRAADDIANAFNRARSSSADTPGAGGTATPL
jgi:hypothetical protein